MSLESITEPVSEFAAHHPALAHGVVLGAEIVGIYFLARWGLQKLGVIK